MVDLTTLQSLRDRVANATGPDREIDALIWWHSEDHSEDDHGLTGDPIKIMKALWGNSPVAWSHMPVAWSHIPSVTASIDAALAWMELVLPGWRWGCDPSGFVRLWKRDGSSWIGGPGFPGPTVPLAIILAVLDALAASPYAEKDVG
jgi:hypothetical protein